MILKLLIVDSSQLMLIEKKRISKQTLTSGKGAMILWYTFCAAFNAQISKKSDLIIQLLTQLDGSTIIT